MTQNVLHLRVPASSVRAAVAILPQEACGGGGLADAMMVRCGMALLGRIKQAFVQKARGGTDEAGERWAPLSPKTIAYSKTRSRGRGGRTKAEKGRGAHPSQALNARQQTRWWALYRQGLAIYKGDKGQAARRAWGILKREGATTLLDKYGHRKVEILRDTGLLLNSLSPGTGAPEQVFRTERGAVTIGTNRKGARGHHEGIPGKLPQRRLWPEVNKWPALWWRDIEDQIKQGLVDIAIQLIKGTK